MMDVLREEPGHKTHTKEHTMLNLMSNVDEHTMRIIITRILNGLAIRVLNEAAAPDEVRGEWRRAAGMLALAWLDPTPDALHGADNAIKDARKALVAWADEPGPDRLAAIDLGEVLLSQTLLDVKRAATACMMRLGAHHEEATEQVEEMLSS